MQTATFRELEDRLSPMGFELQDGDMAFPLRYVLPMPGRHADVEVQVSLQRNTVVVGWRVAPGAADGVYGFYPEMTFGAEDEHDMVLDREAYESLAGRVYAMAANPRRVGSF